MRISDWSSDVCSSDLHQCGIHRSFDSQFIRTPLLMETRHGNRGVDVDSEIQKINNVEQRLTDDRWAAGRAKGHDRLALFDHNRGARSEERRVGKGCVMTCSSRWLQDY